jgi:hypothetical protein
MLSFILNTDDPEQDGLLDSFFSSGKAISQELVRNDSVLAFQIVPVVPSVGETQLWDSDHLSTDTYLVAVGNEDEPPTGGTWPLTLGANTASAIAYNVTAAALQSALMAAGFGTLTVLLLQAGVYQVTWTANGAIAQMTSAANTLSPDSGVTVNVVAAGSASTQAVQVITLRQSVVAAAAPATQLPAAAIAATVTRAGSGTVNKIYALTMTAGTYGGTFSLTVTAATGAAQGLGVVDANISAEDFAALLATQTVIASTDNVSVQRVGTVLNVEFVGTQGLSDVPVIAVTNIDLLAPKGVSGTINFNTIPLNRAFWNTTETELTYRFAVRRTRATGEEREFYNASVTLKRNLIDASTMVAVFTGGITIGTTGIIGGTSGRVLYDNAGVVGEISGATSDGTTLTLIAPVLGAATATSINGNTIETGASGDSLLGTVAQTIAIAKILSAQKNVGDQRLRLPLTYTVNTGTTYQDLTFSLPDGTTGAGFAIAANEEFQVYARLSWDNTGGADAMRFRISGPAGSTIKGNVKILGNGGFNYGLTAVATFVSGVDDAGNVEMCYTVTNGGTPGTVKVQCSKASETDGSQPVVYLGAVIIATRTK